ncbi:MULTISPECIES: FAD-dependent monooxygenase [Pseudonocardia]|uniref:FAD-binding monooxygenase n=2 Tax=Pseudonocardia TaxID=1847 RepID=A0ABQ0RXN0_9PSEU|nr:MULTISPECIES: FAD-dependent monooxygenase [Pseudonocardia]OSY36129.1 putative tryptophan hydroxylase VioD [Pseudonocardia autotrophica]TDN77611.1 2-polyprenyl-6-methoxyphenol hydroxylase-like FAD-dependent oxidoreductase [Pseudonocardia autotrophica]BBG01641.1 FAD-binding monooxygenase [Pseudonocardia autotrophica]GEC25386.1 FAD-binding monooxygenase [Pseudonocardia saturnea]
MRIACVGGGPTGLYLAILARLRSGGRDEVVVHERNERGWTHGFGVTFGEDLLDDFFRTDPAGAPALRRASRLWSDQMVRIGDLKPVHLGGKYGYSMARVTMLQVLTDRAEQLGVDLRFGSNIGSRDEIDADIVVASDGVGSRLRTARAEHFGTTLEPGENRYVWLGTDRSVDVFTFAFERTDAGWIWFYAYPSADGASTCIVECAPDTWAGLGLDTATTAEGLSLLESIFSDALGGHRLLAPATGPGAADVLPWLRFREVRNRTWRDGDLVLAGDAAHTTHFGIGSGTVLAVQDGVALADRLYGTSGGRTAVEDRIAALSAYDARRRAQLCPVQDMARRNMQWFERAGERLERGEDPVEFSWALLDRRGDMSKLHYRLHRATQIGPVRQVRRTLTSARRVRRAAQRGERGAIG